MANHKIIWSTCITALLFVLWTNLSIAKTYNVQGGHWWDIKKVSLNKLFKYKDTEFNVSNIKPNLHKHWISSVVIEFKIEEYKNRKTGEVTRVRHRISYLIVRKNETIYKIMHTKSQDRYNFKARKIVKRFPSQILKTLKYRQSHITFTLKPHKLDKVITVFVNGDELGNISCTDNINRGSVYLRLVGIKADVNVKYTRNKNR